MPTRMKSAERRDAIVQCAIHLFAERGFRGTTTRELAAAVGVTEPVLYQHFRTKRDLYNAIIEAKSAEAGARAAGLKELAAKSDDRAFFGAVGDAILARYRDDPEIPRLMLFSCLERHELAGLFFERLSLGLHQLATSYIRRRVRDGGVR